MSRARAALVLSLAIGAARPLDAQPGVNPPDSPPSATLEVYHVSMGEGEYYWEKFGHNALWFRDPARGLDVAFNWGTFDFNEPGFLAKVLTAEQRYWVDTVHGPLLLEFYQRSDRQVVVQRLRLTPEQAARALQYALWNAQDANKYYRYDYFRDNCSTRVRDVIDLAIGGALRRATEAQQTALTYRAESLRLVDDMPLTQFGINAALGPPADVPLSVWEAMFVPSRVRAALASVTVPGPEGGAVPLVAEERVLYQSRSHAERTSAPDLRLPYLVAGLVLGALLLVPAWLGVRSRGWDIVFRSETALWALVTGALGVVILLAWMMTRHVYWYGNQNLLLCNPLALFLAVLAPLAGRARWRRPAAILAIVIAMLAAVALLLKGVPALRQDNLAMIFLILPAQFAIAFGLWRRAAGRVGGT